MCFSFLNMFNSTRPGKRLHNTNWKDPPFYSWENPRTFDWVIFNSYLNITRPGTSRMKPSRFRITGNSIRTYRTMGFTHGQTLRLCRKSCSHIPRPVDSYGTTGTSILYFFFGGYPASNSPTGIVDHSVCFPRGPGPQTSAEPRDVESFCHRILNFFQVCKCQVISEMPKSHSPGPWKRKLLLKWMWYDIFICIPPYMTPYIPPLNEPTNQRYIHTHHDS